MRRSCTPRRARVVQHFLTRRILSVEARYLHYFVIALLYQVHAHMMCATHAEVSDRCRRQNENGSSRLILSYLHPMLLHLKRFTLTSEAGRSIPAHVSLALNLASSKYPPSPSLLLLLRLLRNHENTFMPCLGSVPSIPSQIIPSENSETYNLNIFSSKSKN